MKTTNTSAMANLRHTACMKFIAPSLAITLCLCCLPVRAEFYIANTLTENDKISAGMIKTIFLGEMHHWDSGEPISLCVDASNKDAEVSFYRHRVGKNAASYRRHWTKRVFSGDASETNNLS